MKSRIFDGYIEDVVDFKNRAEREKQVSDAFKQISSEDFIGNAQLVTTLNKKKH